MSLLCQGGRIHISEQTKELLIPGLEKGYADCFERSHQQHRIPKVTHPSRGNFQPIDGFVCYVTRREDKNEFSGGDEVTKTCF